MQALTDSRAVLGEGPTWHRGEGVLYWVDIERRSLYRYDPRRGANQSVLEGVMVTALAEADEGGLVLVTSDALLTWAGGQVESLVALNLPKTVRTNDGKSDPLGRFWFGTMDLEGRHAIGELMVYDGEVRRVFAGTTISNGLGWSPSGDIFYHIDSVPGLIYRHRYDLETGTATERQILVDLSDASASPDGMAVDVDGNLWVAMWDGWAVHVYNPDGRLTHVENLSVQRPTCVVFGGPALADLYITTASLELTSEELKAQPEAGMLLSLDPGIRGVPIGASRL